MWVFLVDGRVETTVLNDKTGQNPSDVFSPPRQQPQALSSPCGRGVATVLGAVDVGGTSRSRQVQTSVEAVFLVSEVAHRDRVSVRPSAACFVPSRHLQDWLL